jgi:hypothetical protein
MNKKQRKDLNKYVNNHNEKIRAAEEAEFNKVKSILEDNVRVLDFRRNAFTAKNFVFETDAISEEEIQDILTNFMIQSIEPVHNRDNQINHLDDIRLRVRVQLREEEKDTSDKGENFIFTAVKQDDDWKLRARIQANSFGGTGAI